LEPGCGIRSRINNIIKLFERDRLAAAGCLCLCCSSSFPPSRESLVAALLPAMGSVGAAFRISSISVHDDDIEKADHRRYRHLNLRISIKRDLIEGGDL
jgi:hypothetical protein